MEIERTQTTEAMVLSLLGRLDAHWAEQLDRELAELLRGGARRIDLEMGRIDYISSAGIRILLKYYKQLRAIQGTFRVVSPSDQVRSVLRMGGMLELLGRRGDTAPGRPAAAGAGAAVPAAGGAFQIIPLAPGARLTLRLAGDPQSLTGRGYAADGAALTPLRLPADVLALGLGAFGSGAAEGIDRIGEFMALGGAALCQPTDGSTLPDDQVAVGDFVPTVWALYAALCTGRFAHFFHFEPRAPGAAFPLSRLVREAVSLGGGAVGMAMIAETEGLVGAQLRRSPGGAGSGEGDPFALPGVRDRIALTPEPAHPRTLTLAAGIAAPGDDPRLAPFLRPLEKAPGLAGHFHAAALSYRALPDGLLDLAATVAELVAQQRLLGLFHLLNDRRPISGIGESRFIRGAVWAGPLEMETAGSAAGGRP